LTVQAYRKVYQANTACTTSALRRSHCAKTVKTTDIENNIAVESIHVGTGKAKDSESNIVQFVVKVTDIENNIAAESKHVGAGKAKDSESNNAV